MKRFGCVLVCVLVLSATEIVAAKGFDTGPTTINHKALRKRFPIEADLIAEARALFDSAGIRFAELAKDGAYEPCQIALNSQRGPPELEAR